MTRKQIVKYFLVISWIAASCYLLYGYWTHESAWVDSEIYTIYFLKMTILTFPLGLIAVTISEYAISGLSLLGLDLSAYFSQQTVTVISWLTMVTTGFIQWFILIPKLYNRFVKKMGEKVRKGSLTTENHSR